MESIDGGAIYGLYCSSVVAFEEYYMGTLKIRNLHFCETSVAEQKEVIGGLTLGIYKRRFGFTSAKRWGSEPVLPSEPALRTASVTESPTAPVPAPTLETTQFSGGGLNQSTATLNGSGMFSIGASA
jgi:hypothetical protein